ncbi:MULTISPECIES: site-specific integrase [Leptotrichia]|jgi:Site-specific recombinase XerD|uniref:tyrosine-type recombinase/integrase n=1 Tax=Leptotrichia TaxID=32067 RepID=UPI0015BFCC6F|nr:MULTISPECIES: site-specific integrase [Leptotrichia]NWO19314.1 site-specific integrase [Leptotrichia sp. oral taxon 223]
MDKKQMTIAKCMDIWIKNEHNYIKESTYALYLTIIEKHLKVYFKNRKAGTISNKDFESFILNKLKYGRLDGKGGLSRKTVKDMVIILKAVLNFAMKQKIIKRKDFDYKIPQEKILKKVEVFTSEERLKIFKYIENNLNSRTLGILICLCTGLRIGEICALKWEDIDLKNGFVNINHTIQRIYASTVKKSRIIISSPKTENSRRTIPIASSLVVLLEKFQMDKNFYVISGNKKYIEPRTYRKFFKKILTVLNISKLKFHSLRHTFATQAIENNIDYKTVSEILGHSSVNTTLNLYIHPNLEYKKKCMNIIFSKISDIAANNNNKLKKI